MFYIVFIKMSYLYAMCIILILFKQMSYVHVFMFKYLMYFVHMFS